MASISAFLVLKTSKGYVLSEEDREERSYIGDSSGMKQRAQHLIGGKKKPGEKSITCALREFSEEAFSQIDRRRSTSVNKMYNRVILELSKAKNNQHIINTRGNNFSCVVFVIDVSQFSENRKTMDVYEYLENFVENFTPNRILKGLFYWNPGDNLEVPTSLLVEFLEKINPRSELEDTKQSPEDTVNDETKNDNENGETKNNEDEDEDEDDVFDVSKL